MYIPSNINELLDERIRFCESVLNEKDKIPDSIGKKSMLARFDLELNNFKEIKKLLEVIPHCKTFSEKHEARRRFAKSASRMLTKMINRCNKQLEGVSDPLIIHQTLDLIEGLEKINLQINNV